MTTSVHLCEDVQKATEQKFSLFRESSKKKAKKKSTFLPSEKQQQQTNERRKGFGLFFNQKQVDLYRVVGFV